MRILFLGPADSPTHQHLVQLGQDEISATIDPLTAQHTGDFLVSHGYRHILPQTILDRYPGRAINLHISLLPWNRGADPNFWSWLEASPKGVTIHHLDAGIDTGDIIAQREVTFPTEDWTLATSYQRLQDELADLFREEWSTIRAGTSSRRRQPPGGSYHRASTLALYNNFLTDGWDTPTVKLTHPVSRYPRGQIEPLPDDFDTT